MSTAIPVNVATTGAMKLLSSCHKVPTDATSLSARLQLCFMRREKQHRLHLAMKFPGVGETPAYSSERRSVMVIVVVGPEDDDGPVDDNNKDNKCCCPGHLAAIIMLD